MEAPCCHAGEVTSHFFKSQRAEIKVGYWPQADVEAALMSFVFPSPWNARRQQACRLALLLFRAP
jgi:hypothetical protein